MRPTGRRGVHDMPCSSPRRHAPLRGLRPHVRYSRLIGRPACWASRGASRRRSRVLTAVKAMKLFVATLSLTGAFLAAGCGGDGGGGGEALSPEEFRQEAD